MRLAAVLSLSVICFLLPAVAWAAVTLRVVVPALPSQLDPHKAVTPVDRAVASELFLGLTARDSAGLLIPGAATWQSDPNGLTYTFTLRRGLAWSDGTPLEAADFAAGLTRARDPATAAPFTDDLALIANLAAQDSHTLKIVLARPSATFLNTLSTPIAAPVPRHRLAALSDTWATPENIVTDGPFTVTSDTGLALMRNARASNQSKIDKIVFQVAASAEAAATLVRDGDADLTLGFLAENAGARVVRPFKADRGQNLYFVAVNTSRAPLNIRELRHALGMTIDREGLVRDLRLTEATPAYAFVPPAVYGDGPHGHAPYAALSPEVRAAIAEALLTERKIDAAHPVAFSLLYPAGLLPAGVAKNIVNGWVKFGIHVNPIEKPAAEYGQSLRDGDYDLALAAWTAPDSDPVGYLLPLIGMPHPRNYARYAEPDFKTRMQDADAERDPALRLTKLSEAEAVLLEDQPILPIFFFTPGTPVGEGLKGWQPNGYGIHPLHALSP